MTDNKPVEVVPDNNPDTPEDTVVTARFNRAKIAKYAGVATATLGGLAVFASVMKKRGRDQFIEDVHTATGDDVDETTSS